MAMAAAPEKESESPAAVAAEVEAQESTPEAPVAQQSA